ncbi:hypothetical protein M0812_10621 [Anaeramoeba flamelloides]|uniref:Uncharacterized protein n=1 Tax=Anaeramoeba flamelloides TaxID=1746091 RepID=A0AAV7ZXT9_9EUKA|nr:hypothetical protein M0812_10621 [Anaeramoeba flamelloides]
MDLNFQCLKNDAIPLFDELQDLYGIFLFQTYRCEGTSTIIIEEAYHFFLMRYPYHQRKAISRLLSIICQLFIQNEIFLFASTNKNNYQTYTLNSYWKPCFEKVLGSKIGTPNEITQSIFSLHSSQFHENNILEHQFGYPKIEITETGVIYDGKRISPHIKNEDNNNKRKRRNVKKKKTRINKTISMLTYMSICELKNGVDSREIISINTGFARQRICAALSVYKGLGLIVEMKKKRGHLYLNRNLYNLLPEIKVTSNKLIEYRRKRRKLKQRGREIYQLLFQQIKSGCVKIKNVQYLDLLKKRLEKLFSEKEIFYTGSGGCEYMLNNKKQFDLFNNYVGKKILAEQQNNEQKVLSQQSLFEKKNRQIENIRTKDPIYQIPPQTLKNMYPKKEDDNNPFFDNTTKISYTETLSSIQTLLKIGEPKLIQSSKFNQQQKIKMENNQTSNPLKKPKESTQKLNTNINLQDNFIPNQNPQNYLNKVLEPKNTKSSEKMDQYVAAEGIAQLSPKPINPRSPIMSPFLNFYFSDYNSGSDSEDNVIYPKGARCVSPIYSRQIISPISFLQMSPPNCSFNMNLWNKNYLSENPDLLYIPPVISNNFNSTQSDEDSSSLEDDNNNKEDRVKGLVQKNNHNSNVNFLNNDLEQNSEEESSKK